MNPFSLLGLLSVLIFHPAPAPTTQPGAATQPSRAELAIVRPLLAEADKQAAALGDKLAQTGFSGTWLEVHIRARDWPAAEAIINATSPKAQAILFHVACQQAAYANDPKLAHQILDQHLQRDRDRDDCLAPISAAEARHGDIAAAVADLKLISERQPRLLSLAELAVAQSKAGDAAAAKASCDQMAEALNQLGASASSYQVEQVLRTMAQIGDMDAAHQLAAAQPNASARYAATVGIAQGRALAGDFSEIEAILSVPTPRSQDPICIEPGVYLTTHGDIPGAQRVVSMCHDPFLADLIRGLIGQAQVRAGDIQGALATAEQIDAKSTARLYIYFHVIRARSLAGDAKGAADAFALAQQAAAEVSPASRASAAMTIADAQAAMGDTHAAIAAIAQSSQDPLVLFHDYSMAAEQELGPPPQ